MPDVQFDDERSKKVSMLSKVNHSLLISLVVIILIGFGASSFILYRFDRILEENKEDLLNMERSSNYKIGKMELKMKDIMAELSHLKRKCAGTSKEYRLEDEARTINLPFENERKSSFKSIIENEHVDERIDISESKVSSTNKKMTDVLYLKDIKTYDNTTLQTNISDLAKQVSTNTKMIIESSRKLEGVERRLSLVFNKARHLSKGLATLDERLSSLSSNVKFIEFSITNLIKNVNEKVTVLDTNQKQMKENLNTLSETVRKNAARSDNKIAKFVKRIVSNAAAIGRSLETVNGMKANLSCIEATTHDVSKRVLDLSISISKNNASVGKYINNLGLKIATNVKNILQSGKQIKTVKSSVTEVNRKATELSANIIALNNKFLSNVASIKASMVNSSKRIDYNKKKNANLKEFVSQMYLHMHVNREKETEIGMSFADLLKRLGQKDLDEEPNVIKQLVKQKKEFDDNKVNWGLADYKIILGFTDDEELKGNKNLTTIKKVSKMFTTFDTKYKTNWGIKFANVIRLTTKADIKAMKVEAEENVNEAITVLAKIEHMFQIFTSTYSKTWGITFKEVIDFTKSLDFKVTDATVPTLQTINSWCVTNFTDVWGDGSFKSLFNVMKDIDKDSKRKQITQKLGKVVSTGTLKYLPAKFAYDEELTAAGYVEVFISQVKGKVYNLWGTLNGGGLGGHAPNVLCTYAGYASGVTTTDKIDSKINRNNMTTLVKVLFCMDGETTFDLCSTITIPENHSIPSWDHSKDAKIKCTF